MILILPALLATTQLVSMDIIPIHLHQWPINPSQWLSYSMSPVMIPVHNSWNTGFMGKVSIIKQVTINNSWSKQALGSQWPG